MKNALVTGASGGIGEAMCSYLEERGYRVLAHARTKQQADALCSGNDRLPVWGDVTRREDIAQIESQVSGVGALDLLVHNAGILTTDKTPGANGLGIQAEVNVVAPVALTQALLPALEKSKNPNVLIVSSGMASFARSNDYLQLASPNGSSLFGHYAISKCAANTVTQELAKAYPNLKVISVEPGFVKTKMTAGNSSMPFPMGILAKIIGASPEKAAHKCFDHVLGHDLKSGSITQSGKVINSQGKKWSADFAIDTLKQLLAKAGLALN